VLLAAYEAQYDVLPELELKLSSGRAKPGVSVYHNLTFDWEEDVVRYTVPPPTAIEVLSPTQAFDELVSISSCPASPGKFIRKAPSPTRPRTFNYTWPTFSVN
jgi:hypothetical protein